MGGSDVGATYVFERVAGVMTQTGKFYASDASTDARFGAALDLSDGTASGVGIASLPSFIAQPFLRDGRLVQLLAAQPLAGGVISAIYPHRRHLSPALKDQPFG